jgi:hypothetical protein
MNYTNARCSAVNAAITNSENSHKQIHLKRKIFSQNQEINRMSILNR